MLGIAAAEMVAVACTASVLIVPAIGFTVYTPVGMRVVRQRKLSGDMTPMQVGERVVLGRTTAFKGSSWLRRERFFQQTKGRFAGPRYRALPERARAAALLHEVGRAHQYREDQSIFRHRKALAATGSVSALLLFFCVAGVLMYPLERDASRRAPELADAFGMYTQQDKRRMESALRACRFTCVPATIRYERRGGRIETRYHTFKDGSA